MTLGLNDSGKRLKNQIEGLKNRSIDAKMLERVARAVYKESLEAIFNLEYTDKDEQGNTGCIDTFNHIRNYMISLGLNDSGNGDYSTHNLARPAFWFASREIWRTTVYQRKEPNNNVKPFFLWYLKEELSEEKKQILRKRFIGEYAKNEKSYMLANLSCLVMARA